MKWYYLSLRLLGVASLLLAPAIFGASEKPITNIVLKSIDCTDAGFLLENGVMEVEFGDTDRWPSVRFSYAPQDYRKALGLAFDIANTGNCDVQIEGKILAGSDGSNKGFLPLAQGESGTLYIHFWRSSALLPEYIKESFINMRAIPGGFTEHWEVIDLTAVVRTEIVRVGGEGKGTAKVRLSTPRLVGEYKLPSEEELSGGFFPFVDEFGQYKHKDWPGKTKSAEDMVVAAEAERKDLNEHPSAPQRDEYGGWSEGPQLEATGHFRTEKYNGKWWLVDPLGRLFWSDGITCMIYSQDSPLQGREKYFEKATSDTNFLFANLSRKYKTESAEQTRNIAGDVMHKRLRSWGINTIANWSDRSFCSMRRTPYTATLSSSIPKDMPSEIDEAQFRKSCAHALLRGLGDTATDPWCIGYFVDNELHWPGRDAGKVAEAYYRIVSEELKKIAPDKLYLGSRIHTGEREVLDASARYCDVVSVNRYNYLPGSISMPAGIDKPFIIGEFHFGALDRGLFHTGLRSVYNQQQRADIYENYLKSALSDSACIGAHWFQYTDQVCSGRFDGENYQIGFIDICDNPYPEMVAASRQFAEEMYPNRLGKKEEKD
jgi:hypothetical protein